MRKPLIFLWKVIQSVFYLLANLLSLSIYLIIHFVWYFRFPEAKKINVFIMGNDYDEWNILEKHIKNKQALINTWPTDIHQVWDWKRNTMTVSKYESEYANFVFFESKNKK